MSIDHHVSTEVDLMSRWSMRAATAAAVTALAACSANTPLAAPPASSAAVSSVTLPSGEHVIRAGSQMIRFGGHRTVAHAAMSRFRPAAKKTTLLYGSSYDGGFVNI